MAKTIATFSNGYVDEYKGHRCVKAAWMITRKSDGKILASGHSLDAVRAAKTASGKLIDLAYQLGINCDQFPRFDVPQRLWAGANYSYLFKTAAKYGYEGPAKMGVYKRWATAKNAERRAAIEAASTIEIAHL